MITIEDLIKFVYKKYPEPTHHFNKKQFEKRCLQIYTAENAIGMCLDRPFADIHEVLEEYRMDIIFITSHYDINDKVNQNMVIMYQTLTSLLAFVDEV